MIDRLIQWLANNIIKVILPSTLLKFTLTVVIVASFLSLFVGYGVIIVALVWSNTIWLVSEYLYAKQTEDEEDEKLDDI